MNQFRKETIGVNGGWQGSGGEGTEGRPERGVALIIPVGKPGTTKTQRQDVLGDG